MALGAIIGGGLALGGLIGGLANRPDKLSRGDVTVDPHGRALQRYNELRDPTHMFRQFRQVGRESAGTVDQFLQGAAAMGGSERLARARQQASRQKAGQRALDAFRQFRISADQQANQALDMHFSNRRFTEQLIRQREANRAASTQSAFNNVAGIGSTLLGDALGSGDSSRAQSPLPSFDTSNGVGSLGELRAMSRRASELEDRYGGYVGPLSPGVRTYFNLD